ncbi:CLUMA_CG012423, isoform A [Clunio marinus]|uniref:CLUMA_CG012423, isoform A n=1 Tax=Clunio marinus TaxID=568069 RepID=A0A1J1IEJ2_9DIPT|nr:CLUMA_CG012423, isoform A [Clunio marinus]
MAKAHTTQQKQKKKIETLNRVFKIVLEYFDTINCTTVKLMGKASKQLSSLALKDLKTYQKFIELLHTRKRLKLS